MISVRATRVEPLPDWAIRQRFLIDRMNEAAPAFQQRYTRADGTFYWRDRWPGMDGSDDGYESYHNWPLFYALGGSEDVYRRSRFLWDAVTRQFTEYGQVYREFDAGYDWMHHGEGSLFFYYFGLAEPDHPLDRGRTRRFAAMYTGEDPEAPNWDAQRRMMRSPLTGSRGPRTVNEHEDWCTHRAILANYPPPFDDIPDVPGPLCDWNDDTVYACVLRLLNERQMQGDVPLNLTATSLITHAFLHTGDDAYRRWVLDYLEAWAERIAANGGLCPDNVGPSGVIGERMGGKWWGGYYGWQWPHGFMSIIQPLTIAAMNAVLLTGDFRYLDIPRGQIDRMIELGREEDGRLLIPKRYTDAGWTGYEPLRPEFPLQIWYLSQDPRDADRLARFPERATDWATVAPGRGKGDDIHIAPWYRYLQGENPDYPGRILDAQWAEVARRLDVMAHDDGDPETWDVHHWQDINPVHTEALLQLTCGGPQVIYHGGLLQVRLRCFDADARRPGLPPDVAALVSQIEPGVRVTLVNTGPLRTRRAILQAGAFGEHRFTSVVEVSPDAAGAIPVQAAHFEVDLPPATTITLWLGMDRFVHTPGYAQPI